MCEISCMGQTNSRNLDEFATVVDREKNTEAFVEIGHVAPLSKDFTDTE